jgi:hypothetical protein
MNAPLGLPAGFSNEAGGRCSNSAYQVHSDIKSETHPVGQHDIPRRLLNRETGQED